VNPTTLEIIESFRSYNWQEVERYIQVAGARYREWRELQYSERALFLHRAAAILRRREKNCAEVMSLEMGKPISQSYAEVEKCAWVCEYYADHAESILAEEQVSSDASKSCIRFDPIGVILAVMPWNFPFWQVFRFAAPALMAGNVCLLKHASNVPQCALLIEDIFRQAVFPEGCFTTLLIGSDLVENIIAHENVAAVTLTGSELAGSKVAECAGKHLKKSVLELGGSDPFIVLSDADVEAAAKVAATARLINTGQSCIAAKRFIVVKEIAQQFLAVFSDEMKSKRIGDPMAQDTEIGPIAREDLLLEVQQQISRSVELGARVTLGGKRLKRQGVFFEATILTDVRKGMPAYGDELFGPVASVIVVENEEEAIATANDSAFGLGASLWTRDLVKAEMLARHIESGSVFINGMVKSDPRLPFGGVKRSGYGRELSHYGIKEFVNIKTVWIK